MPSAMTPSSWCDVVGRFCAPALFIAGVGKCGTNALSEHLAQHPRVARHHRELPWDPRDTSPQALVAHRRVMPDSARPVWVAKHPKYAMMRPTDIPALARRLRTAYPHARLALTLCDPVRLPWRRFLFLLTTALTRHGVGAGRSETMKALTTELRSLNSSLTELFAVAFNVRDRCRRDAARSEALLSELAARGFGTLYDNAWLRPGPVGEAKCRQEWELVTSYAEQVKQWVRAIGPMNESVAVVYMERWARDGPAYVRTLLRMLRLPADDYPWRHVDFGQLVYANVAAKHVAEDAWSPRASWLPSEASKTKVQQCEALTRVTAMTPPWCAPAALSASPTARPFSLE